MSTHSQPLAKHPGRIVILLLVSVLFALQMSCAKKKTIADEDLPPWSTVINLYEQKWDDPESAFFNTDATSLTFAPALSNLIHAAVNRDRLATLEFDPLYHTHNADIKNLNIARPVYLADDQGRVEVTFFKRNEPIKIQVDVVLLPTGQWKVANIRYPDNTDLISILIN